MKNFKRRKDAEKKYKKLKGRTEETERRSGMIKLKPCPFCGSEAHLSEMRGVSLEGSLFMVECSKCSAIIGRHHETYQATKGYLHFYNKEDATNAWNRRASEEKE